MEENLTAQAGTVGEYKPPKNWKDLSVDEKLERIREQIKGTQRNASGYYHRFYQIEDTLHNHKHDMQTGEVLVSARKLNNASTLGGALSAVSAQDEVDGKCYF